MFRFDSHRSELHSIEIPWYITRKFIQSRQDLIFLFGNDLWNKGCLGQAWEFFGEPNTIAIPTCRRLCPSASNKYWTDGIADEVKGYMHTAFDKAWSTGKPIIPCRRIGDGCSRMSTMAPETYKWMCEQIHAIECKSYIRIPYVQRQ